jgi:hypothetical protein
MKQFIYAILLIGSVVGIVIIMASTKKINPHHNFNVITECIEGHSYYHNVAYQGGGGIAPKLDDEGKPIHCDSLKGN